MVHDTVNPLHGGSIERSMQIGKALFERGHQIDLLTLKKKFDKEYAIRNGVNKYFLLNSFKIKYIIPLFSFKRVSLICREYDVIHISKNWSLLVFFISVIAKKNKIPYIFSPMGWVTFKNNKSVIFKNIFFRLCTKYILKHCNACITVSNNEFIDCKNIINNVIKIPNGFDKKNFQKPIINTFKNNFKLLNKKTFLFLGRMHPIKGVDILIESFINLHKINKDWQLVLIGPQNEYRTLLENIVKSSLCKERIFFIDPLFDEQKIQAYYACDVFVVPSRYDAMTIVAVEAAACGKPIIITETSDFQELYESGGSIQVAANIEEITFALNQAILSTDEELTTIGNNAKVFVNDNYEWNIQVRLIEDVFKDDFFKAKT